MISAGNHEIELLRAREKRYSALVENSPYCIHEINAEGRLVSMNPAGLRMMGATDECAVVGTHYLDAVSDQDRPRIEALLRDALAGLFSEFEFTAANGRVFRSNFVPLPAQDGSLARLMGITQDITERRQLEQQLLRDRHLDAIGRLAGGVAHDFNNLLTVIMGAAELIGETAHEMQEEYVLAIRDAAERASELTSQLLSFARKQVLRQRVVDLHQHLEGTKRLLGRLLTENIRFETVLEPVRLNVWIDPGQLDQLILNLAANARDAMPEGGSLLLRVDRIELDSAAARRHAKLEAGSYVRIELRDSGHGMHAEDVEHIFEPFYTTKHLGGGTGLGLATCHGIVRQAHGSIDAASTEGQGTKFTIHLPLVDAAVESPAPRSVLPAVGNGAILVVEDDAMVRKTVTSALVAHGYDVVQAASAEDAIAAAQTHDGHIDLLATDVVLPGINGRQLADELLRSRPSMKVIFSSGYEDDVVLESGNQAEDLHFLAKPYSPSDLIRRIVEILDD